MSLEVLSFILIYFDSLTPYRSTFVVLLTPEPSNCLVGFEDGAKFIILEDTRQSKAG